MPYLKGTKLTEAQRASINALPEFIDRHIWFVCLDGSVSKRHVPRKAPLDDHDLALLVNCLQIGLANPYRELIEPEGTSAEHYHALIEYVQKLRES